jgi:hypothetical protein
MSEKKNIVIKVKYPNPNSASEKNGSIQKLITEWNIKRIGLALGILILLIGALFVAFNPDNEEPELSAANPPAASITNKSDDIKQAQVEPVKPEANKPVVAKAASTGNIVRALLTDKINRNEPGKTISTPSLLIGRKETRGLYYFAELKGMKEQTIYHEWFLNDQLVSRKKVNISSDPWRTSSKQMITYTMNNDWKVRLVDDAGNILNEKKFNLELK